MQPIEVIVRSIIIHDGKILVCRAKGKDHYFLPGGHVEFNENLEEALEREFKEETGKQIISKKYLTNLPNAFTVEGVEHQETNHIFSAELSDYNIESQEKHIEFHWLSISHLLEFNILPENLKSFVIDNI